MKAPGFWYPKTAEKPWQARLLAPLGSIYASVTQARVRSAPRHQSPLPVICVGNINAGGTGKTPTVIALAEHLGTKGLRPAIVSRGYGGRLEGPVRVDPERHTAADVGDEPLLMAAFAPVWVSRDRTEGVRAVEGSDRQVILFDDGFQDPSVAKTVSFVVIDAVSGFGNGCVIPAGPLRETVPEGLRRASAIITIGGEADQRTFDTTLDGLPKLPRLEAVLDPLRTGLPWKGLPVLAFAGIGRPEKFFRLLEALGADVLRAIPLGDHQPLTPALMARLEAEATARGAQLVTTEKDAVRLPAAFRQKVVTLPVRLRFRDPALLSDVLAPALDA